MATSLAGRVLTRSAARRTYSAAAYEATPVPSSRQLHVLNRLGCGFSVQAFEQLRSAGGADAWIEQQLDPSSVPETKRGRAVSGWFPRLADDPATIWQNDQSGEYQAWEYARDLSNCSMLRRVYSSRSLLESMVELWSNHLHVETTSFPAFTQRPAYDATIRRHALGRFSDLLVACSLHPAMLLYLDNWKSVRGAPNENQGRELLELHTVGVGAGYTEQMVKDSAKILSGHTVRQNTWDGWFDPNRHTSGAVTVLGFSDANAGADPGLAERYLRYLAHHEATAHRVARKIAVRFVADEPSDALVDRLATTYLDHDTDITAVLRALVTSDEFWASRGQKVRTPMDDLVATMRALRVVVREPTGTSSFANELSWALNTVLVYQWPRPDGMPDRASTWASTTRMLNSWSAHWGMAGGWWPNGDAKYRAPAKYLPKDRIRFDRFVDHLSREVLGRRSTDRLLEAACTSCALPPGEVITKDHDLVRWMFPRLLAVLLDSPEHMTR